MAAGYDASRQPSDSSAVRFGADWEYGKRAPFPRAMLSSETGLAGGVILNLNVKTGVPASSSDKHIRRFMSGFAHMKRIRHPTGPEARSTRLTALLFASSGVHPNHADRKPSSVADHRCGGSELASNHAPPPASRQMTDDEQRHGGATSSPACGMPWSARLRRPSAAHQGHLAT